MKKVVRLTEADLNRVVKRIINEGVTVMVPEITSVAPTATSGTFKFDVNSGLELFDAQGKSVGTYNWNPNPDQAQ